MPRNTSGQRSFAQVPGGSVPRSSLNRSFGLKTTFDAGWLIPVFVDWAVPGDTFNLNMTGFARLATPLHPFMDNMKLDVFFFAVPDRLLWDNFVKFMGEQVDPGDSTDYLVPTIDAPAGGWLDGDLADHFGIPTEVAGLTHSVMPFRAFNLIWNEWFRDENLQDSATVNKDDGPDSDADYPMRRRGKRHDYFTSCLPWPQKGDSVSIPLGDSATVVGAGYAPRWQLSSGVNQKNVQLVYYDVNNEADWADAPSAGGGGNATWYDPALEADLTTATAVTINALREAVQLQKLLERDARGGSRYSEIVRSHFGISMPDSRWRSEYLGGGSIPLNVNPVPQTSETDTGTPQANLAAFGVAARGGIGFTKSFDEHSIVIGVVSARADLNYQQGLERHWSKSTRYDFYWPAFAHLGEQAVLNKEIYAQGDANDDLVFGYQERWAEMRYKPSLITGKFRSTYAQSLDTWHLAQEFTSLPVLGDTFIQENPPVDRVIAVTSEPHFLFDAFFKYKCARPIPTFSVPGLIDHF